MNRTTRTAITAAVTLVAGFGLLTSPVSAAAAEDPCAEAVPYAAATMPAIERWSDAMIAIGDSPLQDAPTSEWLELYDASNDGLEAIDLMPPPAVLVAVNDALRASFTTGREMSEAVINDDVFAGLEYGDDLETNSALLNAANAEFAAACTDLETI